MVSYVESMDGPVVKAAETALDMENINYITNLKCEKIALQINLRPRKKLSYEDIDR